MTRRGFLTVPVAAAMRITKRELRPATLDLREPMRRASECIINRMDPSMAYQPWFAVEVVNGRPTKLRHDIWDFGDTTGRFLEALILARQMIKPDPAMTTAEDRIRTFFNSLFDSTGLIYNPTLKQPDHMFAQGSGLYALVTDFEQSHDAAVRTRIEKLIDALNKSAVQEADYLWFPQVATKKSACPHMAAYQILPAVRFYELTGYAPALRFAARLSRWPLYHDDTVTVNGVITKTGWEGHLHAWMDTFSGILRCARAGAPDLNHSEIAERAYHVFEWVKANHTSPFGWVADSVGATTCETDTITSAIRLALELIKEGHAEYWNDIERFVRNQLVENQFRKVEMLHLADPVLARGIDGCFESWADSNTLLAVKNGDIEGCCINGGMRGLFLASQNAIQETAEETRVNLLLSAISSGLEVASYLPYEGRLELYPSRSKQIRVRTPDWLHPEAVRVSGPASLHIERESSAILLKGAVAGVPISLEFEQPEMERMHTVATRTYRALWRGDTVVRLLPAGNPYPIYQRTALNVPAAPLKPRDLSPITQQVHW
jgi:GH24 family phage-related lysozyme (muramidase)